MIECPLPCKTCDELQERLRVAELERDAALYQLRATVEELDKP